MPRNWVVIGSIESKDRFIDFLFNGRYYSVLLIIMIHTKEKIDDTGEGQDSY